jgi:hypothetical protein
MLVTSDGKRVLPESDEFFVTLGRLAPDREPIDFAVRDLGFVKIEVFDHSIAVIELHPRNVDRRALLATERRIAELGAKLFLIKYLDDARQSHIASSAEEAIVRLRALRAPPETAAATERFRVEPQDYTRLLRNSDDPFCRLSRKWCESFGEFDATVLRFAAEQSLVACLSIVGVAKRDTDPVFRFLGDALFPWLGWDGRNRLVGRKTEAFPDSDYGAWISGFHRSVAACGEPRFDRIIAQVRVAPGEEGTYLVRNERLLLPWRSASGETFVSGVFRRFGDGPSAAESP